LRIPKKSNGPSRDRSWGDFAIEAVVYGGGGALLGFLGAFVVLFQFQAIAFIRQPRLVIGLCTLLGFLIGLFGGEAGINWIGRRMRDWQQR
jgi:hypothetical protein